MPQTIISDTQETSPRKVWAIADTHLGFAVGKTMERFGPHWDDHAERIRENARAVVGDGDVLLLPGDLSWAMKRRDAEVDLAYLATLPGVKVCIKGNHDYWWESDKPIDFPGLLSPPVILGDLGIAGTRGWFVPPDDSPNLAHDRRILERERKRLVASLEAIAGCSQRIAMTHYPPLPFLDELREAGVVTVAYGHLHLNGLPRDEADYYDGATVGGIRLFCVAADRVDFVPRRLL